jgi:4-amino-4-deoxy-L-arabinose transferase-like glycosyltransferase
MPMPGASVDAGGRGAAWALAAILAFAALLRLGSLGVTEVEWWDSTIYLTEARRIAEGVPWAPPYERHRAPLLPWLGALSYAAGLGERGVYLANVLFSVGTVGLLYAAGALLFGRRAGLFAAFFMAVSWESLFFTQRVLTETPALFFWTLSIATYAGAVVRGRVALLPFLGPAVALAFLAHFRAAAILPALAIHFVAARRWGLLRRKEVVVSALLGLAGLASYVAFSARRWGTPFELIRSYQIGRLRSIGPERLEVFGRYLAYVPTYLGSVLFALLVGAVAFALGGALRSRAGREIADAPKEPGRRGLLLAALVLVPLAVPGLFEKFHHRLGILCLPGLFLLLGAALERLEAFVRERSLAVARVLATGLLAAAGAWQLGTADEWLHAEGKSYLSVKEAGLWVGARAAPGAVIVTTSWPQVNFYAERPRADVPGTLEEFEALAGSRRPPFLVLSEYERKPAWVEGWLAENAARVLPVSASGDLSGQRTRVYDLSGLTGDGRHGERGGGGLGDGRRTIVRHERLDSP